MILISTVTVLTFQFDISFAFHTPGSGSTIIGGQVYANNGTDELDPFFVRPQNDTITFANPPPAAPPQFPLNPPPAAPQQPINGTQTIVPASPSDVISQLNLARQAVDLGDPGTILKVLDFIQQQVFLAANATSDDFSTLSNSSSTGLNPEITGNTGNTTTGQPEDMEDFVPVEEQRPTSSASHRDPAQRTRTIQ